MDRKEMQSMNWSRVIIQIDIFKIIYWYIYDLVTS